jgi:plastocyanin
VNVKKTLLGGTAALALASPLAFCAGTSADPMAHTAAKSVTIVGDSAFSPATVKIVAGKRVNWSWSGSAAHNVTFAKGKDSATGKVGSFSRKFSAPGKYAYVCTIHGFTGKVVVK